MYWNQKFPWLSLGFLILTYVVFGWFISESSFLWSEKFIVENNLFSGQITSPILALGMQVLGAGLVLLICVALTNPIKLLRFCFGSWLDSDNKALVSILLWAFAAVLIVSWLEQFLRLLVLYAAGILARLDLETLGCNQWQTLIILVVISLGSFALGVFSFQWWNIYSVTNL